MRSLTTRFLASLLVSGALAAGIAAGGCASLRATGGPPLLAPASLGEAASASQRLSISRLSGGDARALTLDAVVEVDAEALRLAGFLLGQRVLLLAWDGRQLEEVREPVVPAALRGEAVLRDLQLVYWPAAAIRDALPAGWRLEGDERHRRLLRGGRVTFESERADAWPLGGATLVNHAAGYRIVIESARDASP